MKAPQTVPTVVTLAEWLNAGRCPSETQYEAGRLFVELNQRTPETHTPEGQWRASNLAALRKTFGVVVLHGADEFRVLERIEVDADSISCLWRRDLYDGKAHPAEIRALDKLFKDLPKSNPTEDRKLYSPLDSLLTQWYDTPEPELPKRFPLDPVVQAWMESRGSGKLPAADISLKDYVPDWQRYRQDVRKAVEKDARELKGRDVHISIERATTANGKHGGLRSEDKIDLLVGLLRAADCQKHPGDCRLENQAPKTIRELIVQLGKLGDLDHSRIARAFASGGGRKYGDLRNLYSNRRTTTDGAGLTKSQVIR